MTKLEYKDTTHVPTYEAICDMLRHCAREGNLSKMETLAIASNLVGKLMAMQDPMYDHILLNNLIAENINLGFHQGRELVLSTVEVSGTA
jgi:hypothetical protein